MILYRENNKILETLKPRKGIVKAILDTDTYNEIDDQFALVQMLFSHKRINTLSINAAPFSMNSRSDDPQKGMELSYDEIFRLLEKINLKKNNFVFKGSKKYIGFAKTPINSPAADNIIESAIKCSEDDPLYVIAIGAITNVASAILQEPEIINKIVVVWLGGNALYWPNNNEFNLKQDIGGSQVLFDSGVSLILVPCNGVTSHLMSTVPEIEKYIEPHGKIGKFLAMRFKEYNDNHKGWSKEIWDMAAISWVLNEEWTPTNIIPSPILLDDKTWKFNENRHPVKIVYEIKRDLILQDFIEKLEKFSK
ncbi:MAG: nucleoside hydrolase [Pelagibacteraceae bacterium]|jgi:inosine-uridine nucleoside N-ribohydrolase|nr:nucleoside hydrolase [Pelagibacteraceae bacterium]MBT5214031.1 nucleoside hydrolase [Pelagibacteraceae bacterium]